MANDEQESFSLAPHINEFRVRSGDRCPRNSKYSMIASDCSAPLYAELPEWDGSRGTLAASDHIPDLAHPQFGVRFPGNRIRAEPRTNPALPGGATGCSRGFALLTHGCQPFGPIRRSAHPHPARDVRTIPEVKCSRPSTVHGNWGSLSFQTRSFENASWDPVRLAARKLPEVDFQRPWLWAAP